MISASIIVPCFNQLEFTRHCFRALFRHTRPPFELIAIDNGSTDGTGMYLSGVQDSAPAPVTGITNATNRGFPAAISQGLHVARGEYFVMLNNDAVVTDWWLDSLIALTEMRTNFHKEEQEVQEGENQTEGTTNQTNLTNPDLNPDPTLTPTPPSGRFGLGFFDDDLAIRARRMGYQAAVAHDLFIHHFGSRTFHGNGIDAERLLQENGRKFAEKWGLADGRWQMADGKWQMANGRWQMAKGKWPMGTAAR